MVNIPKKYIFSNLAGTFIFNEHFNIINKVLFRNIEEYQNREKYEKGLVKRYKNLKRPEGKEVKKILENFKDKSYFVNFYQKNIALTKQKIKESVTEDLLIVQTVRNIKSLDKTINILIKDLREWYSLYNPEFSDKIKEHQKFIEAILKSSKSKSSMGRDLSNGDLEPILALAKQINGLYQLRGKQETYLKNLMKETCPNLTAITGHLIGAKLIEIAGSLKRLALLPASTVQLLGAEEALFRHLRTGAKPPRHGVIVQHPLISSAPQKEHGKRARALADKISIAVKVDFFKGKFIGDRLRKKLEDRFKKSQ